MDRANQLYRTSHADLDVLPMLRDTFSWYPEAAAFGPEALAGLLHEPHNVARRGVFDVEVALEALAVEGEVLA
jgi:hypothetical protein